MKTKMREKSRERSKDSYLELVRRFPLRAIRSDAAHAEAIEALLPLAGRDEKLDAGEREYLDALTVLVKEYERRHHQFERRRGTPLERLRYLMEESGMSTSDLGRLIGSQSSAWQVLNGKRELSKAHIRRLAEHFRLNPGYFM